MRFFKTVLVALVLASALPAAATEKLIYKHTQNLDAQSLTFEEAYATIDSVTVTESELSAEEREAFFSAYMPMSTFSAAALLGDVATWGEFLALGKEVWQIIVNNKPVVNVQTNSLSILPKDQPQWQAMEKWQGPYIRTFNLRARNLMGVDVIKVQYRVLFNYGGSWQGKGQYLANVTVIPSQVDVAWGFSLNSEVVMSEILNTGTLEDPIPSVNMQMKWKMDSVLKHLEGVDSFYVKGDGQVVRANDF